MAWIYLFIAGLFEVVWALSMKLSEGFTKPIPSTVTIVFMLASFGFLAAALRQLPIGTAYAVWTGIGVVGTSIIGIVVFREPVGVAKIVCIHLIVLGIVGLKLLAKT